MKLHPWGLYRNHSATDFDSKKASGQSSFKELPIGIKHRHPAEVTLEHSLCKTASMYIPLMVTGL